MKSLTVNALFLSVKSAIEAMSIGKGRVVLLTVALMGIISLAQAAKLAPGLYVTLKTSKGKIVCRLFPEKAPVAIRNFGLLAQGVTSWTDPKTGKKVQQPFYDGLSFYRVKPGELIEGGDPLEDGTGGPGFVFEDEIHPDLTFDQPGRLALARSEKPDTNGSRFFITAKPILELNGRRTIFGQVVEGQKVVDKISHFETDEQGKPTKSVILESMEIFRIEEPVKKTKQLKFNRTPQKSK